MMKNKILFLLLVIVTVLMIYHDTESIGIKMESVNCNQ